MAKNYVVYANTDVCLEQLKVDIEQWLDQSDDIKGDALIIQGDMKQEVKFISAEMFTQIVDDLEGTINRNDFSQDFDSYCGKC